LEIKIPASTDHTVEVIENPENFVRKNMSLELQAKGRHWDLIGFVLYIFVSTAELTEYAEKREISTVRSPVMGNICAN